MCEGHLGTGRNCPLKKVIFRFDVFSEQRAERIELQLCGINCQHTAAKKHSTDSKALLSPSLSVPLHLYLCGIEVCTYVAFNCILLQFP